MISSITKNKPFFHQPVLLQEVLANLQLAGKKIIVDATGGLGGHASGILSQLSFDARVIVFDADKAHLEMAKKNLSSYHEQVVFIHANFRHLKFQLEQHGFGHIDGILFDLGLASPHVDNPVRGFSFLHDGALDMRFDTDGVLTAEKVINTYSEKDLIRIFRQYGEEKKAFFIAKKIVEQRKKKPFATTIQLAEFLGSFLKRVGHIHPATRVFQALRIEVNDELKALEEALEQAVEVLNITGRLLVISYHSLEDRIVKRFFKQQARSYINLPSEPRSILLQPLLNIVLKKPIVPSLEEIHQNFRSRSAKLRVAEKI